MDAELRRSFHMMISLLKGRSKAFFFNLRCLYGIHVNELTNLKIQ